MSDENIVDIKFSEQFFGVLKNVCSITKAGCTLLFKGDAQGRIPGNHISIPSPAMMTHLAASSDDLDFDTKRVNIFSLSEFVKYAELVGYPKRGRAELLTETSITGKRYEYIKFSGGGIDCRTPTADPSCFKEGHSHIPYTPEADPMTKVGVPLCS